MLKYLFYSILILLTGVIVFYFYPETRLPKNIQIDKIIVFKSRNEMEVYSQGQMIKNYKVSIGKNSYGDKEYEGDERTPEGEYQIDGRNPNSAYFKNLGISYPNKSDREHSAKLGKPVGGDVKIHGLKNGQGYIGKFHRFKNWTNGCIAVTNEEMEELYNAVRIGTAIIIKP
jgi:murein L,D-transpeptidase YafK